VKVYHYIRNTHLLLALFCGFFLLMYGVSSIQMAHNKWFQSKGLATTTKAQLPPSLTDSRAVGRQLMNRFGFRGELVQVRPGPKNLRFMIARPGVIYQVNYAIATGDTQMTDNQSTFMFMMNRIHHLAGLDHDYWLTNAWGVFVGIVSVSLIVIGLTGLYLWFKMHRERAIGAVLLVLSFGYSLTLLAIVRTSW
jgi:hypothetical protein